MIRINVHEAKTQLSRYLERVERGEVILLCRRNVPIAEIRPATRPEPRKGPRPFGLYRGRIAIADDFDAPMGDAELAEWYEAPLVSTSPSRRSGKKKEKGQKQKHKHA
jgi:prevent-host-death family protein